MMPDSNFVFLVMLHSMYGGKKFGLFGGLACTNSKNKKVCTRTVNFFTVLVKFSIKF